MLNAEPLAGAHLGVVRRHGLAAWLRGQILQPLAKPACAKPASTPNASVNLEPTCRELTRIIAGIVLSLATEPAHA